MLRVRGYGIRVEGLEGLEVMDRGAPLDDFVFSFLVVLSQF